MNGQACTNSSAGSASRPGGDDRDEPGPSRASDEAADQDNPPEPTSVNDTKSAVTLRARGARLDDADRTWLLSMIPPIAVQLPRPIRRLDVAIVDDAAMTELHERHCGQTSTTDVLTFAQNRPDEPIDADLAVCADEANRQASARGHARRHELLLYILHGLLHCAGYDDHTKSTWEAMHAEEDRILEAIGVGRVFAGRPDEGDQT